MKKIRFSRSAIVSLVAAVVFLTLATAVTATARKEQPLATAEQINSTSAATLPSTTSEPDECVTDLYQWSDENITEVVSAWNYDESGREKLTELQHRLADINHFKSNPAEAARFLNEHNMDVDKAEKNFREMIAWRLENRIDYLVEEMGEPDPIFYNWPCTMLKGLDHDHDPIVVERLGMVDAWGIYKRMGGSAMLDAALFFAEVQASRDIGVPPEFQWQLNYYEPLVGRRFTQFTIIIDLEGLHLGLFRPTLLKLLQENAQVCQHFYPGMAKRIILLRAPRVFKIFWDITKHFYLERVRDKFVFATNQDYVEVVSKYLDVDVLPPSIYPEGKGENMPGFCERVRLEGGPIPKDA